MGQYGQVGCPGTHLQPLSVACSEDELRAVAGKAEGQLLSQSLLRTQIVSPYNLALI